jgi:hypothetical protein
MTLHNKPTVRLLSAKDSSLKKPIGSQLYKLTCQTSRLKTNAKSVLNSSAKKEDFLLLVENSTDFQEDLQLCLTMLGESDFSGAFNNQIIGWNLVP